MRQLCLLLLLCSVLGSAHAERFALVQQRGLLLVGVKADYPPFGMRNAQGELVGFEPDLAAELARRLGVRLQLSAVTSANRLQKLEEGAVDMVLATLNDTAARRRIATLLEPHYYASGVTLLLPPATRFTSWSEMRGRKVCATQGAYYNREMAQRYLLDLQIFNGVRDTRLALRDGRCVAWLYDDLALAALRRDPEWSAYQTPLPTALVAPWAVALAASEAHGTLARALEDALAALQREGWFRAAEQRWGLTPNPFVVEAQQRWAQVDAHGNWVCQRLADGNWPPSCRDSARLTSQETQGVQHLGLLLRERTGLDFTFIYDAYDRDQLLRGLWMSIQLMVACIAGSLLLGCLGAVAASGKWIGWLVRTSATLGRMTPPLLLIYIVFFGLGHFIVTRFGWPLDGFLVASACLSLYAGCSTVFALLDASAVLQQRHPGYQLRWRTLLPALRLAYTPIVAILVNVVKATGMASAIAVPELIYASTALIAENGNRGVMMNVLMLTYFLLVLLVVYLFAVLERRFLQHKWH